MRILTCQQVRELDRRAIEEFGVPGLVLMENAGRGTTDLLVARQPRGPITIVCGGGNNGGDGFVIARHLDLRGYTVRVVTCLPPDGFPTDARTNYEILRRSKVPLTSWQDRTTSNPLGHQDLAEQWISQAAWVVDALLGTGSHGDPRPPLAAVIRLINAAPAQVLAVDLPSGLDADTGMVGDPTVQADMTCTFVAPKPGLLAPAAQTVVGQLHCVDIGAPGMLVREYLT